MSCMLFISSLIGICQISYRLLLGNSEIITYAFQLNIFRTLFKLAAMFRQRCWLSNLKLFPSYMQRIVGQWTGQTDNPSRAGCKALGTERWRWIIKHCSQWGCLFLAAAFCWLRTKVELRDVVNWVQDSEPEQTRQCHLVLSLLWPPVAPPAYRRLDR
jgi:hypothetical protein